MKNTIDTETRTGIGAAISRFFERINVAFELHYIERDIAFERALAAALPAKVKALEHHAEHLRVRQATLRNN